jgi:hypothetical protein
VDSECFCVVTGGSLWVNNSLGLTRLILVRSPCVQIQNLAYGPNVKPEKCVMILSKSVSVTVFPPLYIDQGPSEEDDIY